MQAGGAASEGVVASASSSEPPAQPALSRCSTLLKLLTEYRAQVTSLLFGFILILVTSVVGHHTHDHTIERGATVAVAGLGELYSAVLAFALTLLVCCSAIANSSLLRPKRTQLLNMALFCALSAALYAAVLSGETAVAFSTDGHRVPIAILIWASSGYWLFITIWREDWRASFKNKEARKPKLLRALLLGAQGSVCLIIPRLYPHPAVVLLLHIPQIFITLWTNYVSISVASRALRGSGMGFPAWYVAASALGVISGMVHITEILYLFDKASHFIAELHIIFSLLGRILACFAMTVYSIVSLDERRLLAAMQAQLAAAEEAAAAKAQFLRYLLHEVRVPFNSVLLGITDLDESQSELSPDAQATVKMTRVACEHMLAVLSDALDVGRIEAGAFRIALQPVNVRSLAELSLVQMSTFANHRRVTLSLEVDAKRPLPELVLADPNRLQQIINNLVSNAIKFTSNDGNGFAKVRIAMLDGPPAESGSPTSSAKHRHGMLQGGSFRRWLNRSTSGTGSSIRTSPLASDSVVNAAVGTPISGHDGGAVIVSTAVDASLLVSTERVWIQISVQDNGAGVPTAELSKIFKPYQQLQAGLQYKGQGTGLGLAIASQIAKSHGGGIKVYSDGEGHGSTFTVWLHVQLVERIGADGKSPVSAHDTPVEGGGHTSHTTIKAPAPSPAPEHTAVAIPLLSGFHSPPSERHTPPQPAAKVDASNASVNAQPSPSSIAAAGASSSSSSSSGGGGAGGGTSATSLSSSRSGYTSRPPPLLTGTSRDEMVTANTSSSKFQARAAFFASSTGATTPTSTQQLARTSSSTRGSHGVSQSQLGSLSPGVVSVTSGLGGGVGGGADSALQSPDEGAVRHASTSTSTSPQQQLQTQHSQHSLHSSASTTVTMISAPSNSPAHGPSTAPTPALEGDVTPASVCPVVALSPSAAAASAGIQQYTVSTFSLPQQQQHQQQQQQHPLHMSLPNQVHTGAPGPLRELSSPDLRAHVLQMPLRWLVVDDVESNRTYLCRLLRRRFVNSHFTDVADGAQAVEAMEGCAPVPVPMQGGAGPAASAAALHHESSGVVLTSATGLDTAVSAPSLPFDVVCMDGAMPVLDGYEATRRIRALGFTGLILGVTGNALEEDMNAFTTAGANAVVTKPANLDRLIDLTAHFVRDRETAAQAFTPLLRSGSRSP